MIVKLKPELKETHNLFGPQHEIEGAILKVMEKSFTGDCMCILKDSDGKVKGLVDVSKCDIQEYVDEPETQQNPMQAMTSHIGILRAVINRSMS